MTQANVNRIMQVMSQILSDKYGAQVVLTARHKDGSAGKEAA